MGLDMYIEKRIFVNENYNSDVKSKITLEVSGKKIKLKDKVDTISSEFAYWRKANWIHGWFVRNMQNGKDDCKTYHLSKRNAKKLFKVCENIYNFSTCHTKEDFIKYAEKELPPCEGFFFGGNNINDIYEEYLESIEYTMKKMKEIDNETILSTAFYYNSSW